MDIIEELKYYCNEPQPVGAIMLTGEWGCGKTYLLKNELTEIMKDTHIFIHLSLFGIESIEDIHKEVKKKWMYAMADSKHSLKISDNMKNVGKGLKNATESITDYLPETIGKITKGVLSINIIDFVSIKSQIGDKKVILIFDDLERANLSVIDLLGCINEYCENMHINTIVVANEEKIKQSANTKEITYDEIKEKIIQRTIRYIPNYSNIVASVIDGIIIPDGKDEEGFKKYKAFLKENENSINAIFSGYSSEKVSNEHMTSQRSQMCSGQEQDSENNKEQEVLKYRSHNIRSLKFAIEDFRRIYSILNEKKVDNKEKWLFSYLSYVLCYRAGMSTDGQRYGTLFSDEKISIVYKGFYNEKYITGGIISWIRAGKWEEDVINAQIDYSVMRDKAKSPTDKVRVNSLLDIEESDIQEGFPILINEAYEGVLELRDYLGLILNSVLAREYNIKLPDINWGKICKGINIQIDKVIQSGEDKPHLKAIVSDYDNNSFSAEEMNAYKIIDEFVKSDKIIFEKNKNIYIRQMEINPLKALIQSQNMQLYSFDNKMANVTAEGFKKISNLERNDFIEYFKSMWMVNMQTSDYKKELSTYGFKTLQELMKQFLKECQEKSLYIVEIHTSSFIKVIEELIDNKEQEIE